MVRRSPQSAALVRAFMEARGIRSIRTARWHRQTCSAEWEQFVASSAEGIPLVAPVSAAAGAGAGPVDGGAGAVESPVDRARKMERTAWAVVETCREKREQAVFQNKPDSIAAWIKTESEAGKAYRVAVQAREKAEAAVGALIPAGEVARLRAEFVDPVREVLRSMPAEIGPKANPMDPQLAILVAEEWLLQRFSPAMAALEGELPQVDVPSDPMGSMGASNSQPGTGDDAAVSHNAGGEQ